jgi:hypothetical protein
MAKLKAAKGNIEHRRFDTAVQPKNDGHAERAGETLFEAPEKIFNRTEENGF